MLTTTHKWLIGVGVYLGLTIIFIIGIVLTMNAIGQCVVQCKDKCNGGGGGGGNSSNLPKTPKPPQMPRKIAQNHSQPGTPQVVRPYLSTHQR